LPPGYKINLDKSLKIEEPKSSNVNSNHIEKEKKEETIKTMELNEAIVFITKIKSKISNEDYKKFLNQLNGYQNNGSISNEKLIEELNSLFKDHLVCFLIKFKDIIEEFSKNIPNFNQNLKIKKKKEKVNEKKIVKIKLTLR
jgi:hypothetical protein